MRHSIGSLSKLSGVSIRALHHYDQIGLLQPSEVAESGYRYYDDAAVEKLWQILFYRELDFPLAEIGEILSSPSFDRDRALTEHRNLLEQKRERLDRLIALVSNAMKGDNNMEFKPFDTGEIDALREQYAEEAKARWGNTDAYRESTKRAAKWTEADKKRLEAESGEIFSGFAKLVGTDPADTRVQALVARWKAFISESYYDCTDEILAGLGQMYIVDERFMKNIDKFGAGTAKLMSDAIAVYCKQ
ncbi:MAG TPA: MerR family transcriptional regulator [Clostridia bacterium]|nr:MerR family transcriptional regulator [Clostridia bacterium]